MKNSFNDFIQNKNRVKVQIPNKDQIFEDIFQIENTWTGRIDAQIANTFLHESTQLLINSISLFEEGYFDASFYSLRQALETATTMIYLSNTEESKKKEDLQKWKDQSNFPMYNQMLSFLEQKENIFSDIKYRLDGFFTELIHVKKRLNKYVHKQGFKTFYVSKNHALNKTKSRASFIDEYLELLTKCMSAVTVFRLSLDPFPILLTDPAIYNRTDQLLTEGFDETFIEKYIDGEYLNAYKETLLYTSHFEMIIDNEEKNEYTLALVKDNYIDKTHYNEIKNQFHLISKNDQLATLIASFSEKISKIHSYRGLKTHFTSTKSKRNNRNYDSRVFIDMKNEFNRQYDNIYLSAYELDDNIFYIEHNEKFTEREIVSFKGFLKKYHTES